MGTIHVVSLCQMAAPVSSARATPRRGNVLAKPSALSSPPLAYPCATINVGAIPQGQEGGEVGRRVAKHRITVEQIITGSAAGYDVEPIEYPLRVPAALDHLLRDHVVDRQLKPAFELAHVETAVGAAVAAVAKDFVSVPMPR